MRRQRSLIDMLRFEATRRPEIGDLIERAPYLTDKQIDELDVPMPWFREAFREVKRKSASGNIEETANPKGAIVEWVFSAETLRVDKGEVFVDMGQRIFVTDQGLWIGHVFSRHLDPKIRIQTRLIQRTLLSHYLADLNKEKS